MTERDEVHLLTGAYALNALEKSERDGFEAHLLESEDLRMEVAGMSETAVLLGLSSRPITPPTELKNTIMSLLDRTPQLGVDEAADTTSATADTASTTGGLRAVPMDATPTASQQESIHSIASGARPRSERRGSEHRARARWFARPVGVLAAAAAAVAIFVSGSVLGQGLTDDGGVQRQASSLAELTAASDLETTISDVAGGGSAKLIWSTELERAAVLVDDLPALDGDRTYQLWYIDGSGARPAGLFDASSAGTSWKVLDGTLTEADSVGITVEPSGGSTSPTSDPILVIDDV